MPSAAPLPRRVAQFLAGRPWWRPDRREGEGAACVAERMALEQFMMAMIHAYDFAMTEPLNKGH